MRKVLMFVILIGSMTLALGATATPLSLDIPIRIEVVESLKLSKSGDFELGKLAQGSLVSKSEEVVLTAERSTADAEEYITFSVPEKIILVGTNSSDNEIEAEVHYTSAGDTISGDKRELDVTLGVGEFSCDEGLYLQLTVDPEQAKDQYTAVFEVEATLI